MKTIVLSMCVGESWREMTSWTHKFRENWAHSNKCEAVTEMLSQEEANKIAIRPAAWLKLLRMRHFISNGCNVIWMDADAVPTYVYNVDNLISYEERSMLVSTDINGMNSGLFSLASSQWALDLLDYWWNYPCNIHDVWWEQRALHDMVNAGNFPGKIKLIDQKPFLIHAAGVQTAQQKFEWLKRRVKA